MKLGQHPVLNSLRVIFFGLGVFAEATLWVVTVIQIVKWFNGRNNLTTAATLAVAAGLTIYLIAYILQRTAKVTLTDEYVKVCALFKWRVYRWDSIPQAGILWRRMEWNFYNDFVILLPGGSPRRFQDKTFALRNSLKMIHLPCTKQMREFVERCYGPLDFDLSDGRPEQSEVMD